VCAAEGPGTSRAPPGLFDLGDELTRLLDVVAGAVGLEVAQLGPGVEHHVRPAGSGEHDAHGEAGLPGAMPVTGGVVEPDRLLEVVLRRLGRADDVETRASLNRWLATVPIRRVIRARLR
jgi:hypothetical protein